MIEPVWLDERDALTLHDMLLAQHGGAAGVRDATLLQSALARPRQHFTYDETSDVIALAGIYTAGIVGNHPFVDGNKRTGFVIGILFLELNGFVFSAREEDAAHAVIGLAGGTMSEGDYIGFLRAHVGAVNER